MALWRYGATELLVLWKEGCLLGRYSALGGFFNHYRSSTRETCKFLYHYGEPPLFFHCDVELYPNYWRPNHSDNEFILWMRTPTKRHTMQLSYLYTKLVHTEAGRIL